jgi:hypothetical protein
MNLVLVDFLAMKKDPMLILCGFSALHTFRQYLLLPTIKLRDLTTEIHSS